VGNGQEEAVAKARQRNEQAVQDLSIVAGCACEERGNSQQSSTATQLEGHKAT
jgi:hypothetical protein